MNSVDVWFWQLSKKGDTEYTMHRPKTLWWVALALPILPAIFLYFARKKRGGEEAKLQTQRLEGKDAPQAVQHLLLLARQGDADAQNNLGLRHWDGEGVPQSSEEAAKYFKLAAQRGYAIAQYNLGMCYKNGQ